MYFSVAISMPLALNQMAEANSQTVVKQHLLSARSKGTPHPPPSRGPYAASEAPYPAIPSRPLTQAQRLHSRGQSEASHKSTPPEEVAVKVKARVAGALGFHRSFLQVPISQEMTREKRQLEKSLEATKAECVKLK